MRIYDDNGNRLRKEEIITVFCNKCKKEIRVENHIIKEGIFSARHLFGYFSGKDGESHSFDLCEECYDKMIGEFLIPPEITEVKELL